MPDKILFIDTETGGLNPIENSLLSIGFVLWSEFNIIETKEIFINDGVLNVTQEALSINNIDISKHKLIATDPISAINEMDNFFNRHFDKSEKITLGGHNINFDINFIRHFLFRYKYDFPQRFSHRYVDTAPILYFLYFAGKLNKRTLSSQEAFDYFNISVSSRHSALGDAIATAQLFNKLVDLVSCINDN